ncbi:hypothetical protein [Lysobacter gummosus]|uniref:hypothetical protein n=1 Tax=Lysobacter gummosus TaxID=262324 RepID=UPI00362A8143
MNGWRPRADRVRPKHVLPHRLRSDIADPQTKTPPAVTPPAERRRPETGPEPLTGLAATPAVRRCRRR